MCEDILELSYGDHLNYIALCRFIDRNPIKRSSKRPGSHRLTGNKKINQLEVQNYLCFDCGKKFDKDLNGKWSSATGEHVIPYRYGSSFNRHNRILLCGKCNSDIRNKLSYESLLQIIEKHFGLIVLNELKYPY